MAYFLLSVSNRVNLELCRRYALAGFTNSINGVWTFLDIQEGDFVSFLYGAKVYDLYRVAFKRAFEAAEALPPWPSVTFSMSGKTYYFPFRLHLEPIRELVEPLVRAEFAYVAENLLLRGGYRKTHFQADQTTLQAVSQMGELNHRPIGELTLGDCKTFVPHFTSKGKAASPPEVFLFSELILQSIVRQFLASPSNLGQFFPLIDLAAVDANKFEALGEKAFPEGHVDIMLKEATPLGSALKIVVEIKLGAAKAQAIEQIHNYAKELGGECAGAVLIAKHFPAGVLHRAAEKRIRTLVYSIGPFGNETFTFEDAKNAFALRKIKVE